MPRINRVVDYSFPVAVRGYMIDASPRKGGVMTGSTRVATCDICIVGAGIAGLNALFAACRYLSRTKR